MRTKHLKATIVAASLMLPGTLQAQVAPFIRMGDSLSDLNIDVQTTKELQAGTIEDPKLFLHPEDDETEWTVPFALATPDQGVCAKGALSPGYLIDAAQIEELVRNFLRDELPRLESEAGSYELIGEGGIGSAPTSQSITTLLQDEGKATLAYNPSFGDIRASTVHISFSAGSLRLSYLTTYENFDQCVSELGGLK